MPEWLRQLLPESWSVSDLAIFGGILFLVTTVGSIGLVFFVVTRLPADYFRGPRPPRLWPRLPWWLRGGLILLKNLIGWLLIALGILMSLPGVPGQGLLTILIGTMAIDFPGKRKLEQWLVRRPGMRAAIDRLRIQMGRPPLLLDDADAPSPVNASATTDAPSPVNTSAERTHR